MTYPRLTDQDLVEKLSLLNNTIDAKWSIVDSKLTKEFYFENFIQAFAFMDKCCCYINNQNHHPEWFNVYNKVIIKLITHDAGGISKKDFDLAMQMEHIANS